GVFDRSVPTQARRQPSSPPRSNRARSKRRPTLCPRYGGATPTWLIQSSGRSKAHSGASHVFDNPIDPRWAAEFLADGRHHLAVAFDGDVVVGMASAVHHLHPDKPPELRIYE